MAAEKEKRGEVIKLTDVVRAEFEALRAVYKPRKEEEMKSEK